MNEGGISQPFCVGAKLQDHSGAIVNLDCTPTVFNEDISISDDTNINTTGIGVSGAEFSDSNIALSTTETNRGVIISQDGTVSAPWGVTIAGTSQTASGARSLAQGNLTISSGSAAVAINTRSRASGGQSFSQGFDGEAVSILAHNMTSRPGATRLH